MLCFQGLSVSLLAAVSIYDNYLSLLTVLKDDRLRRLLRATISSVDHRVTTITALHKAINRKFMNAGISTSFPQRDVHLNTQGPSRIAIETDAGKPGVSTDND